MAVLPFKLVAGHVALDLVNTLDNRYQPDRAVDLIPAYPDFLRFCIESDVITSEQARGLREMKQGNESVLRSAHDLREALERIFSAVVNGGLAPGADVARLSAAVRESMRHRVLNPANVGRFEWIWAGLETDLSGPLWPISEAAATLLVSEDLTRVRQCGSETCRWLFLDTSKNHSRRWCDMKLCGNRIKARNYYQKGLRQRSQGKA